jgi:hypothetical protein
MDHEEVFFFPIYFILFLSLVFELDTSGFRFTLLTHIVHEPFALDLGGYIFSNFIFFHFHYYFLFYASVAKIGISLMPFFPL